MAVVTCRLVRLPDGARERWDDPGALGAAYRRGVLDAVRALVAGQSYRLLTASGEELKEPPPAPR